jgi:subtilase family serine protease
MMRSRLSAALLAFALAASPATALALPDLIVPSVPLSVVPTQIAPNGAITLSDYIVQNQGDQAIGSFEVGFYLSNDATITAADVLLGTATIGGLSAGASIGMDGPVLVIPDTTGPGNKHVGILVDRLAVIVEANEANNFISTPLTVTGPDLDITSTLTASVTSLAAGEGLTLGWTTKNIGPGASAAASVGIFLSTNATYEAGDALLHTVVLNALAPNAQQVFAGVPVTIPGDTPSGSYYLIAYADPFLAIRELREDNNDVSRLIRIGPDLSFQSNTGSVVPAIVAPGGVVTYPAWTARNSGAADAGPSTAGWYLSIDNTLGGGDVLLDTLTLGPLVEGATQTVAARQLTIPPGTPAGPYWVGVLLDHDNLVLEQLENNNQSVKALGVGADLTVSFVAPGVTPTLSGPGGALHINGYVVRNLGAVASDACSIGIYLSSNSTIDTEDLLLKARAVPALAEGGGQHNGDSVTIVLPEDLAPGTYRVGLYADHRGVVPEASETNNTSAIIVKVGPDLLFDAGAGLIASPGTVTYGQSVTLTAFSLRNEGAVGTGPFFLGVYLSDDPSVCTCDLLVSSRLINGIGPGQEVLFDTLTVPIPASISPGDDWRVGLYADHADVIAEFTETNNRLASSAFTVVGPDLLVSTPLSLTPAEPLEPDYTPLVQGFPFRLASWTAHNVGDGPSGDIVFGYYFSQDSVLDADDDLYVGGGVFSSLGPGESVARAETTITVPIDWVSGSSHFGVLLDHLDAVPESNELNNDRTSSIVVRTYVDVGDDRPREIALAPAAPNPARGHAQFRVALPADEHVRLDVYDFAGRRVRTIERALGAGTHALTWDGRDERGRAVGAGVYLYRVTAGARSLGGRLAMLR